ncbi:MBL fold metallo-hydrolase [Thermoclostridium stercorarium subsp. leptospartum DSM 9219]|uniref:MBL fold metallo-hydrolase n=1 Tax=Thermoclostridium stercorarium subsp. leptospartum DSM 9219 TaxID=1346611 RepID=A0A1B1YKK6_THEST|nr:MBL fold metallo-hydrolase [Thermoclostridium stercorarium]ANX01264.1 MBL fold metallo-hydrolase [Thermoclostridium stercorarium subsp. leptospartum DSM 9219]
MIIECIPDGLIQSNVYIVAKDGEGVVIDCGCPPEKILETANGKNIKLKHVILTHGHFDHIYYIDQLRNMIDIRVHIHELDAPCLSDPFLNGLAQFPVQGSFTFRPADNLLRDGDVIECSGLFFKIIHTPGHTGGGICILVDNALFTGDTLFNSSIGRTDFPGGSMDELIRSIKGKLYILPDDTNVYPGHGITTTIGYEKKYNPFCRAVDN